MGRRLTNFGGFQENMADLMVRPNGGGRGLVSDLFGFDPLRAVMGNPQSYNFSGEVQKTEDGWNVEIPVPGFKPDQIDVTVEDRVLTVNGKTERRSFQRSILLPDDVDAEAIEAKVEHGMLALALRLHPKAQPRKIEVKVGN
jgi:HSP20 family molecular chaperone IbpA